MIGRVGVKWMYNSVYNVEIDGYVMVDEKVRDFANVEEIVAFTGFSRSEVERAVYDFGGSFVQGKLVFSDDEGVEGFTHYINH